MKKKNPSDMVDVRQAGRQAHHCKIRNPNTRRWPAQHNRKRMIVGKKKQESEKKPTATTNSEKC